MKTLPVSEELLRKICLFFLTMEPGRQHLVDDCLDAEIYDELSRLYPQFMYLDRDEFSRLYY